MEVIYIDRLFLLDLLTDYLLLLSAARISGLVLRRRRYFFAALLGAVYAVLVYLPGFFWLSAPPLRLAAGVSLAWLAFRHETRPLRCVLVFLAVSAAFGGALWAVSLSLGVTGPGQISLSALLLCFGLCYAVFALIFRARAKLSEQKRVFVRLRFLDREAGFHALVDTGNGLRDPLTGSEVMIVSPQALRPIFREDTSLFRTLDPIGLMELAGRRADWRGRFRLLPYSAVGGAGLLPVFHPERLMVEGIPDPDRLVAVSVHAHGDGFDAIL